MLAYRPWYGFIRCTTNGIAWPLTLYAIHPKQRRVLELQGLGVFQSTLASQGSADYSCNQVFASTARYRGQVVVVKRLTRRGTDLTRAVKKEMKLVIVVACRIIFKR